MSELWLLVAVASIVPTVASLANYQLGKATKNVLDQVHMLTNSNLTRVLADLKMANDRIEKLETSLAVHEREPPEPPEERRSRKACG